jgi:FKBP-type peptidyl-prolyl cis-trans isomerase 2
MKKIENGNTVSVHYKGTLEDGTVFDTSMSEGKEPIKVTLGQGQLIKGFEEGLIGMAVGEKKTITLDPEDAYGHVMPEAVIDVPLSNLPPDLEVGQVLQGNGPQGPFIVSVLEIKEDVAKLDHNHPMAGKKLIFDLDIVSID